MLKSSKQLLDKVFAWNNPMTFSAVTQQPSLTTTSELLNLGVTLLFPFKKKKKKALLENHFSPPFSLTNNKYNY